MAKTILITGATDGIGLEAAKLFATQGHHVLLHGRNPAKLEAAKQEVSAVSGAGKVEGYLADLTRMSDVVNLAEQVSSHHTQLDALINNAGILKSPQTVTQDGLDIRFVVNTIAPYLLTQRLMPLMTATSRVVNLSSAAQAPVDIQAMNKGARLDDMSAYSQSKLAITMWTRVIAEELKDQGPVMIALNPGSLLGTKMVKEGFGIAGKSMDIGANIIMQAAIGDAFADATGQYFDNDSGQFAPPHPDALNDQKAQSVTSAIKELVAQLV